MKIYPLTWIFLFALSLFSPFSSSSQGNNFCGLSQARENLIKEHPEILQEEAKLEEFTKNFVANYKSSENNRSGPIIIPVVFHIIHQGGPENISDAQVLDQVRILNRDYNKENADTSDIIDIFKTVAADMGIEFRLANIDPEGNCTNGIDRVYSVQTFVGNDYSKLNGWPREKYLNIWVVRDIGVAGAGGYAYYPGSVAATYSDRSMDGVILAHIYIGSIGTGSNGLSRACTHELGHCFNMKHVWGDSNTAGAACGDDGVEDTPLSKGWYYCPTPDKAAICNPKIIENYQNYMEYSYCSRMFTHGQRARALAALNSSIADRNKLWTDANLVATGTQNNSPNPCAPKADFTVSKPYICAGDEVKFIDGSFNGIADNYSWEFPTGVPDNSTDKNPLVSFFNEGWQSAKLTVSNSLGNSVKTNNFSVYVANSSALFPAPYYEGFEDPNILQNGWASVNNDQNNTSFRQVNYAGHTGTSSLLLNNFYSYSDHDIDEVISPGIDLTPLTTSQLNLSFFFSLTSWYAYPGSPDSLVVYLSYDCGKVWRLLYRSAGANVVCGAWQTFWVPPANDQSSWRVVNIPIPVAFQKSNVRFKIQVFSSTYGNNFYLDDFNIGYSPDGIHEISSITGASIFPNPSAGNVLLNLELEKAGKVNVKLFDITGKEVINVFDGSMNNGHNQIPVNTEAILSPGVYIVNIRAGESVIQRKLVIE